jgi:hypothetical protein
MIGHANQRAEWAPTGARSQAFGAVGYLFLGATPSSAQAF